MKNLFLFAALSIYITSVNATDIGRHKKPKETKDVNVLDITKNQGTALAYQTPRELKAEFDKEAELKMWDATQRETEWAKYDKGGWLRLAIGRLSIDAANTRFFTVVVKNQTGQEVFREELESSVPEPTHIPGSITVWRNLKIVGMPEELKTGYTVFVIDGITKNRHEYLIKND